MTAFRRKSKTGAHLRREGRPLRRSTYFLSLIAKSSLFQFNET